MLRFKLTILTCILMALVIPYTDRLAVSDISPWYTHYLYIIGHASWLHYAVNAWSLLVMHNLFCWYRVLASYLSAIVISYTLLPAQPMVGASVITCFFFGFYSLYMWRKDKLGVVMTLALLVLTCILPGFAGIPHVAAYTLGFCFSFAERKVWHMVAYLKF